MIVHHMYNITCMYVYMYGTYGIMYCHVPHMYVLRVHRTCTILLHATCRRTTVHATCNIIYVHTVYMYVHVYLLTVGFF